MYKILTKKLVGKINAFLSNDISRKEFLETVFDPRECPTRDDFRKIKENIILQGHGQQDEVLNESIVDLISIFFERNSRGISNIYLSRYALIFFVVTLPTIERDPLNKLFKYSDLANTFQGFRIDNFSKVLNDNRELSWFNNGAIGNFSRAKNIREAGNVLATYTTRTLKNSDYMIANYSQCKKTCVQYEAEEVFTAYDKLYSNNWKPLRGYVRYGGDKTFSIRLLTKMKLAMTPERCPNDILELILTFFVKGSCMAKEEEYRFVSFVKNNQIDNIVLNINTSNLITFSTDISRLKSNCYYCPISNDCGIELECQEYNGC